MWKGKERCARAVAMSRCIGRLSLRRYRYHRRHYPLRDRGVQSKSLSREVCHLRRYHSYSGARGGGIGRFLGGGDVQRSIGELQSKTFGIPETGNKEGGMFQVKSLNGP